MGGANRDERLAGGLTERRQAGWGRQKMSQLLRPVGSQFATIRPKWTANAAAQYETDPAWNNARMSFRVDAAWRSKYRALGESDAQLPESYDPIIFSKSMLLLNARVALKDIDVAGTTLEVALWGKNLTDSDNPAQPIYFRYLGSTTYQRARTFGVDVALAF